MAPNRASASITYVWNEHCHRLARMRLRMLRLSGALCLVAVVLAIVISIQAAAPERPGPTRRVIQASDEYVGSELCMACHQDQASHFQKTVMGKAFAHPK